MQNIKSSVYVLPFYLHISYRRYFFLQLFLLRSKVTAVFLNKLSGLRFIYYHAICTQVTEGMFFNHFLLWSMLPRCFYTCYQICTLYIIMIFTHTLPCVCFSTTFPLLKFFLPRYLYVSYYVCELYITHKLPGYVFEQISSMINVPAVFCMSVIGYAGHILPYRLHTS